MADGRVNGFTSETVSAGAIGGRAGSRGEGWFDWSEEPIGEEALSEEIEDNSELAALAAPPLLEHLVGKTAFHVKPYDASEGPPPAPGVVWRAPVATSPPPHRDPARMMSPAPRSSGIAVLR